MMSQIRETSSALARSAAESGRPRSSKTLPLLRSIRGAVPPRFASSVALAPALIIPANPSFTLIGRGKALRSSLDPPTQTIGFLTWDPVIVSHKWDKQSIRQLDSIDLADRRRSPAGVYFTHLVPIPA